MHAKCPYCPGWHLPRGLALGPSLSSEKGLGVWCVVCGARSGAGNVAAAWAAGRRTEGGCFLVGELQTAGKSDRHAHYPAGKRHLLVMGYPTGGGKNRSIWIIYNFLRNFHLWQGWTHDQLGLLWRAVATLPPDIIAVPMPTLIPQAKQEQPRAGCALWTIKCPAW